MCETLLKCVRIYFHLYVRHYSFANELCRTHIKKMNIHNNVAHIKKKWIFTYVSLTYVRHYWFACLFVTHLRRYSFTYMWAITRFAILIHLYYVTHAKGVTWLIHKDDMTHSYMCHDSFICVTWLIHMCDMTHSYVWHDLFICVTWLIHMCVTADSHVRHDSFKCMTWLIHMCVTMHLHVRHDSFLSVTWLFHICAMIHSYVWRDTGCGGRRAGRAHFSICYSSRQVPKKKKWKQEDDE